MNPENGLCLKSCFCLLVWGLGLLFWFCFVPSGWLWLTNFTACCFSNADVTTGERMGQGQVQRSPDKEDHSFSISLKRFGRALSNTIIFLKLVQPASSPQKFLPFRHVCSTSQTTLFFHLTARSPCFRARLFLLLYFYCPLSDIIQVVSLWEMIHTEKDLIIVTSYSNHCYWFPASSHWSLELPHPLVFPNNSQAFWLYAQCALLSVTVLRCKYLALPWGALRAWLQQLV